ncbi:hypothetical protein [Arthrobacter sp. TB 23]|uniref:hypothetical protein n=1 Tax=Arthrobacter sp. TB 23 TaxID=494419 RepID=UPI00031529A1|nr:hypothetical protein [Arthrobacter sp. TB 23]
MSEALYALALLACPVGMGLMMWFMMRGSKSSPAQEAPLDEAELVKLRAEIDQLRAGQGDASAETSRPQAARATLR